MMFLAWLATSGAPGDTATEAFIGRVKNKSDRAAALQRESVLN
jgi:hypothetical protein